MRNRYSLGEVVRLKLDIIDVDEGVAGEAPTIAIQRQEDGKWFQKSDGTWQVAIINNPMIETNATALPGRYHLDFDQTLDDLASRAYVAKKVNTGGTLDVLEYEDLVFGLLGASVAPDLCSVTGTVYTPNGRPARAEIVRATLVPVFTDALGRGVQSDRVMMVATNELGDFSIPLVRGGTFRLEVNCIGFDRKVTIPDADTALFTDL